MEIDFTRSISLSNLVSENGPVNDSDSVQRLFLPR